MGALDSECSWRLQSEGEPDTQEDFGVKNKHKLQQFLSLATLRTPSQSLIVTQLPSFSSILFYLNSVTKFDGEAALRLNVTKKKNTPFFRALFD